MPNETETRRGRCCPRHGTVEATREVPAITFPWLVDWARRTLASCREPFRCPECGAPVDAGAAEGSSSNGRRHDG